MKLKLKKRDHLKKKQNFAKFKRKVRSRIKKRCRRKGISISDRRTLYYISVPKAMNVEGAGNRKDVIRFFDKLRKRAIVDNGRVILDFGETRFITAPAMLLFIAELDRIRRICIDTFDIRISNVIDKNVKHVLIQIGFYELCGQTPPRISSDNFADNVRHWQFASGERIDDDTNRAFDAIEGRIAPEARKGIWRGFSEALVNSVQHAYVARRGTRDSQTAVKRWWMFTEERQGTLTVAVCDLGIGIPRSLPLNWGESILAQIQSRLPLGTGPDVRSLRIALEVGQTRTGAQYRGRGLPQIWQAVRGSEGSGIMILSNKARIAWGSKTDREYETEFSDSIHGTLVMWTVKTAQEDSSDANVH